jgi:Zn-dependent protease with chaperone function
LSGKEFLAVTHPAITPDPTATDRFTPLAADVKAALESAVREAIGLCHSQITSGHILLGVTAQDCAATRALSSLGATPELVRAAILEVAPPGPTPGQLVATIPLPVPPPGALPSRWLGPWSTLGLVVAQGLAFAAALATIPSVDWQDAAVGYLVIIGVNVPLQILLGGVAARRVRTRLAARAPTVAEPPPAVAGVLDRYRVRRWEIRVEEHRIIRDRSYGLGRRSWIVLSGNTVRTGGSAAAFVLAHEIGHLIRGDSWRRRIGTVLMLAMVIVPLIDASPLTLAVTILASLAVFVGDRWLAEFGADRVAVRWVGVDGMRAWQERHRDLVRARQNRTVRRRVRRILGRLTHPPLSWRAARAGS